MTANQRSNDRRCASSPSCGRRNISGITLLEVLISMGVLAIGILGVASLVPVAKRYNADSANFDRGATLAQQAYHDLLNRDFLSAKKWIDPQGAFTYHNASAVVIDPLGLSYALLQNPPLSQPPVFFPAFPINGTNPPLGSPPLYRASIDATNSWPDSAPVPATTNPPISVPYQMAERIFRSSDDPSFDLPADTDLRPKASSNTLSPDFAGDYSWMFTASHTAQDINNATYMNRYQVSLVVFRNRDLTLWDSGLAPQEPPPERLVYAQFLQNGGQAVQNIPFNGGGSLKLYTYEPTGATPPASQPNRHWLDRIRPNTFLMLVTNFVDSSAAALATGATSYPRLAWYRIISVADGPNLDPQIPPIGGSSGAQAWSRTVTVAGADWQPMVYTDIQTGASGQLWLSADANPPMQALPVVFCALVNDAVAVYTDVVTLDSSLMRN